MSIASEITRITSLRNRMRRHLADLGLCKADGDLDDCAVAVVGITGTKTITSIGQEDVAGYQYAAVDSTDLKSVNIRSGITILGVTGTMKEGATEYFISATESASRSITFDVPSGLDIYSDWNIAFSLASSSSGSGTAVSVIGDWTTKGLSIQSDFVYLANSVPTIGVDWHFSLSYGQKDTFILTYTGSDAKFMFNGTYSGRICQ